MHLRDITNLKGAGQTFNLQLVQAWENSVEFALAYLHTSWCQEWVFYPHCTSMCSCPWCSRIRHRNHRCYSHIRSRLKKVWTYATYFGDLTKN